MDKQLRKLNIGCGQDKKEGYVNIDWNPNTDLDVLQDLNRSPYPFGNNSFDLIEAFHILEHFDRPFEIIKEIHRILKPEDTLHLKVPHFSRGFTHAEQAHEFDIAFLLYLNKNFT